MSSGIKNKVVNGVFWSGIESYGQYLIQFAVMIVIARLISPSDFGIIELLLIFTNLSQIITDSGFSQALIRKQGVSDKEFSTVFYINIIVAIALYVLLFYSSGFIASFYNSEQLELISKVVFVTILLNALGLIHNTILIKSFQFKKLAIRSIVAATFSGVTGIYAAYIGLGVWALVIQMVTFSLVNTILLISFTRWIPKAVFDRDIIRNTSGFSFKIMIYGIIDVIFSNLQSVFIGKFYTKTDLGFYSQARRFQSVPSVVSTQVIQKVTFPALSEMQDDDARLLSGYRSIIKVACFAISPIMLWMLAVSNDLFVFVLTKEWSIATEYFKPLAIVGMLFPIYFINLNILKIKDRYILTVGIIQKLITFVFLIATIRYSVLAVAWGFMCAVIINVLIVMIVNRKVINYKLWIQFKDIMPYLLLSLAMFLIVILSGSLLETVSIGLKLLFQMIIGVLIYIILNMIFKTMAFIELKKILYDKLIKR